MKMVVVVPDCGCRIYRVPVDVVTDVVTRCQAWLVICLV